MSCRVTGKMKCDCIYITYNSVSGPLQVLFMLIIILHMKNNTTWSKCLPWCHESKSKPNRSEVWILNLTLNTLTSKYDLIVYIAVEHFFVTLEQNISSENVSQQRLKIAQAYLGRALFRNVKWEKESAHSLSHVILPNTSYSCKLSVLRSEALL